MVGQTKNLPTGGNEVDNSTYNPTASTTFDNDAFHPDRDEFQPVGTRGADNQLTGRDSDKEDQEAGHSEATGTIPKGTYIPSLDSDWSILISFAGEVNDLFESTTEDERNVQGRTRGLKNDAWKQEREFDQQFKSAGVDAE